jgi:hypothetical protein
MAERLSALRTGSTLLPRNIIIYTFLVLISVRGYNYEILILVDVLRSTKYSPLATETTPQKDAHGIQMQQHQSCSHYTDCIA